MRRAPILTTALFAAAGVVLFAGAVSAQSADTPAGEARGLRYLAWPSRGQPALVAAAAPDRRGLRRPNTVIPHGGFDNSAPAPTRPDLMPAPGARRTLTPANAWMQPAALPPEPAAPEPAAPTPTAVASGPVPATSPVSQARTIPDYLPNPGGRGQAVPADIIHESASPVPVQTGPFDPMAPRPNAPIFRMQQDAPGAVAAAAPTVVQPAVETAPAAPLPRRLADVSNSGERPPQQGGRYYSVHRQNGRQPDALEMPEPTYVDALAVTVPETIASQDLAAPEQGPTLIRDAQGRVRPAAAPSDGDHQ